MLDPFGGSGTMGLVTDQLASNAVLVELGPQYAEMARRRIDHARARRAIGDVAEKVTTRPGQGDLFGESVPPSVPPALRTVETLGVGLAPRAGANK